MNLYEILGVTSDCSLDQLRREYRRLLLKYHPDKIDTRDDLSTSKSFEEIQRAYQILSSEPLRLKYDQELQRQHLHTLPHTNIHWTDDDEEYICRCGTVLEIEKDSDSNLLECPNCSMKIEINK